jgi:uncharacterized protein YndB with AHSA1/START domain
MSEKTDVDLSPLVFTVTVPQSVDDAFILFTEKIGTWWPKATHSIGENRAADVIFDGREDGRLYERLDDGTEYAWGEVLAWEPPNRFVITWHPSVEPVAMTEVEVTFTAIDADSTTVQLTHRDWQRLGDVAAVTRHGYSLGWVGVLDLFTTKAPS